MAQSGFTPVQLYRSTTAAAVPLAANLAAGELAINLTDEKLYFENASGVVKVLADSTYVGTVTSVAASGGTTGLTFGGSPITSSGTLTLTGTLAATNGGTGQSSYAIGDLLFASTTTALSKLADVATGNALISGGVGVAPSYGKIGLTTHVSGTLAVGNGGIGATTLTANGVLVGNGTSAVSATAVGTTGQVLVGNTGAAPTWATLTSTAVTSFSAGTTGLTPSTATQGAITLAGTLAVANGGTGTATAFTAGSVVFAGASGVYSQDNANLFWDNANDRLGIGTASPTVPLEVAGNIRSLGLFQRFDNSGLSLSGGTVFNTTGAGIALRGSSSAFNAYGMEFYAGGSERMRIDSGGNVGIGSVPGVRFQITHDQAAYSYFDYYNTTNAGGVVWRQIVRNLANTGNTSVDFAKLISSGFALNNNDTGAANFTAFGVGGTERMRITSAGNVGIGTSTPDAVLDVNGSQVTRGDASGFVYFAPKIGTTPFGANYDRFEIRVDPSTQVTLLGNVNGGTGAARALAFLAGTNERMRIESDGDVGIGTSSPTTIFHVQQNNASNIGMRMRQLSTTQFAGSGLLCNGPVSSGVQGGTGFYHYNRNIGGTNGAASIAQFDENGTFQRTLAEYYYQEQAWLFYTNAVERMRIDNAGNVGIGTSSPGVRFDVTGQGRLGNGVAQASPSATDIASTSHTILGGQGGNALFVGQYPTTFASWIQSSFTNPTTATYNIVLQPLGGNVGIGTTSPGYRLDVASGDTTASIGYAMRIRSNATATAAAVQFTNSGASSQNGLITCTDAGAMVLQSDGASSLLAFRTNGSERMRVASDGKVGIGTSSPDPSAALDVSSTTAGFLPPRMNTAARDLINGGNPADGLVIYNVTTEKLQVYVSPSWINLH